MPAPLPLNRFLLRFEPPAPFLDVIRQRFPAVDFLVATDSSFHDLLGDADAMLTWNLSERDLDHAKRLHWVQWVGAGVEDAPLTALQARQIVLTNNRGVHAINIAEHVIALMLAFTRALPFLVGAQSRRIWADDEGRMLVRELAGSSLLVVGAGNIGLALADRADRLEQSVTVIGRTARRSVDGSRDIHPVSELDDRLATADHVAICLPLTAETDGLFDRNRFQAMKRGSILYNIGRGRIVVTEDLVDALQSGRLGGAGLDVTDPEPLPPDHPLWDMPNVILTAHTAGATPNYWTRALDILSENIDRYLQGKELKNIIRFDLGYGSEVSPAMSQIRY